ncbi:MAG: exopolysaccharide biosynthesis protein [Algiphilus sp.]
MKSLQGEYTLSDDAHPLTQRTAHGNTGIDTLEDVLNQLQLADLDGDGKVSLREIFETFGTRSFGPVLLILGLIQALPTGGIPLMPDVIGLLTILLFAQMLIKPQRPWLPSRLMRLTIPQQLLDRSIRRARPWIQKADRLFRKQLGFLHNNRPALAALSGAGVATGALIIVMGFVPFAAAIPALSLICFGIGLTAEDGLPILLGYAIIFGCMALGVFWFGLL